MCDLNTASVAEIANLDGITVLDAYDLMLWRPFLDWQEVEAVPGFDGERTEALRTAGAVLVVPSHATWVRKT